MRTDATDSIDRGELEALLVDIWKQLLSIEENTIDTDFFASGGHSLAAMLLIARIESSTGISLPLAALVRHSTPRALAAYCLARSETPHIETSLDGTETQAEYLIAYNEPERQTRRSEAYEVYYATAATSAAHAAFCDLVYGANFGQHGMADVAQLDFLIAKMEIGAEDLVLDIGCGYGQIAEYIHDRTGARIVGIDISSSAVARGNERALSSGKPLRFIQMDLQSLSLPEMKFSKTISIDTIYFTNDLQKTLSSIRQHGTETMRLGVFRTFPLRSFTDETWSPHISELGHNLRKLFGGYEAYDFSKEENAHWRKKVEILESLRSEFIKEGNENLFQFRYAEARYEAKIEQRRYLFVTD